MARAKAAGSSSSKRPDAASKRPNRLLRGLLAPLLWVGGGIGRLLKWPAAPGLSMRKRVWRGSLVLVWAPTGLLMAYALLLLPFTPSLTHLEQMKVQRPTVVLASDGTPIYRFQRFNRAWVELDQISPHVRTALIATEDHRFYDHFGVDFFRLASSLGHTLIGDRQGGSTISMQLARNMYPQQIGRASTMTRKLKEVLTAFKIEALYEKDEILETYLNSVPFLYNVYGIELGAQTYFSKPARDLDVLESATLVGMLKATSAYNPVRQPERAKQRRNVVLAQMMKHGALTPEQFATLKEKPLGTQFKRQPMPQTLAPHFTEHVRRWLSGWAAREGRNLNADGLVVRTTLNLNLQRLAEEAVARQGTALQNVADVEWSRSTNPLLSPSPHDYGATRKQILPFAHFWSENTGLVDGFIRATPEYRQGLSDGREADELLNALRADPAFMGALRAEKTRLETGFVAIDPRSGAVKAWVGSRSYTRDKYDHVAQARRQPGSTFKPFVYAAALEDGYSPFDTFADRPVEVDMGHGQVWRPVNANGISGQEVTLRDALAQSTNTVTVQLMNEVGPRRVARLARQMGVNRSPLKAVPSLALGTSSVTLLEMVSSYTTIASGGVYRSPVLVSSIETAGGTVLAAFTPAEERVLSETTAHGLLGMMRSVIDEGTGQRIRSVFGVRCDVAGKTGTTQDNADGWFLLAHPHLVAGAWVGFNDPRVTFRSDYWGQGAHNALYVVGDFYRHALRQGQIDPRPTLAPPLVEPEPFAEPRRSIFRRAGAWFGDQFESLRGRLGDRADRRSEEASLTPPPSRGDRKARADDNTNHVLEDIDRLLANWEEAARVYREHVRPPARNRDGYVQRNRRPGRRSEPDDSNLRRVEREVRRVLDRYARDLDRDVRRNLEDLLDEMEDLKALD